MSDRFLRSTRPNQKNFFYVLLMLGSGSLFGGVVSVVLIMFVTGRFINPADIASAAPTANQSLKALTAPLLASSDSAESNLRAASSIIIANGTQLPKPQLFRINSLRSQATFSVYETFPEGTATGRTREVAGDIIVDFNTPANSKLGVIRINLRSLKTDDPRRDLSIRCCVLLSARDEYEFAEFKPTAIGQLPPELVFGQAIPFQLAGDLSLRGVTHPITFDVELTLIDTDLLRGAATAVVNRRDFGILNNDDNGFDYHGVANEVTLTLKFEAQAVIQE